MAEPLTTIPEAPRHRRAVLLAMACAMTWPCAAQATQAPPGDAPTRVRIGYVTAPDGELLDAARAGADGARLTPVRFATAAQANAALAAGHIEASIAQDAPSLARATLRGGVRLAAVAHTVTYPTGLYARQLDNLRAIPIGATVTIPAARVEQARALILLQNHGLIRLDPEAGLLPGLTAIVANPRRLRLVAVATTALAAHLKTAAVVALPYEAASRAGLLPARDALGVEDARTPFANVLAVREADRQAPWVRQTVAALQSQSMKTFILSRFSDSVRRPW